MEENNTVPSYNNHHSINNPASTSYLPPQQRPSYSLQHIELHNIEETARIYVPKFDLSENLELLCASSGIPVNLELVHLNLTGQVKHEPVEYLDGDDQDIVEVTSDDTVNCDASIAALCDISSSNMTTPTLGNENMSNNSNSSTDVVDNQLIFVNLVRDHPVLLEKSQLPVVKARKDKAAHTLAKQYKAKVGVLVNPPQVFKKLANMRQRLKDAIDTSVAANKPLHLLPWQEVLYNLISHSNFRGPLMDNDTGHYDVGMAAEAALQQMNAGPSEPIPIKKIKRPSQPKKPPNKLQDQCLRAQLAAANATTAMCQKQQTLCDQHSEVLRMYRDCLHMWQQERRKDCHQGLMSHSAHQFPFPPPPPPLLPPPPPS